ncbi:MAG: DHA1 family bicyclomycin/chloramphenicol resistance-like MFS transporter [Phenylobacterium sp.]|jgi:DHA1 family bicyclomycin/chloramphenicol resistance-like MFS transporter
MTQSPTPSSTEPKQNHFSLSLFLPLLASIVAITPLAIDTYLPAMTMIAADLGTEMSLMQLTLSLFLAGYAAGLLFFGPMADIFGRRPLVLFGLSGFMLTSVLLAFTESVGWFLALRLLQAFTGSAATVTVSGYVKLIYGKNLSKGMSYVSMIMMLAPMIAPTIGVLLLELHGWPLIFLTLAAYALLILVLSILALPKVERHPLNDSLFNTFFKSYSIVLSNLAVRRYIILICFSTLTFFGYLTAISFIYMQVYQLSETLFGILFALTVVIFLLSSFLNTRMVGIFGSLRMAKGAWFGTAIGVMVLLMVNLQGMHVYWTAASLAVLLGCVLVVSTNADALILLQFSEQTGTATGVIGTLRFGFGALAGPILALFYDGSAMPFCYLMLFSVVAVGVCLFVPSGSGSTSALES